MGDHHTCCRHQPLPFLSLTKPSTSQSHPRSIPDTIPPHSSLASGVTLLPPSPLHSQPRLLTSEGEGLWQEVAHR